ncbi:hypothetical protein C1I95_33035, partial [Micromonospora craterilacus]
PERLGRLPIVPVPPAPAPAPASRKAAALQPQRDTGRPWWRRRWNWAVLASSPGYVTMGHCWTESGARRRADRHVRRAAR